MILIMLMIIATGIPFTGDSGLKAQMTHSEPIDFFNLFITENIKDHIYLESTKYANQYLEDKAQYLEEHKFACANDLKKRPMERREVNVLLAIFLTMGILGYPSIRYSLIFTKNTRHWDYIRSYWSTKWPFHNGILSSLMSGRRFELLLRYIHLSDSRKQPPRGDPDYDKLYKIRPFLDAVVSQFKSVYSPKQNVSIDESIIGFKGRLSFVQYMPKKPTKWGIKSWVLAESDSGYVWNMKVYTGIIIIFTYIYHYYDRKRQ